MPSFYGNYKIAEPNDSYIYIYINNQDNILTSNYGGDIILYPSQTQLQELHICDNSIKYDEHFSVLDCSSYILYKYDISNMDNTSFYFYGLYINQQYQNDTYTYYISHISIENTYKFNTTYFYNYLFNVGTMCTISPIPLSEDKVAYMDIHFTQHSRATSAPTNKPEYQIYLTNHANKSSIVECFSTLQPDFKLGFNFYDYKNSVWPITYNLSKNNLESTYPQFMDLIKFDTSTEGNYGYINMTLNTDGYKLKEITKDVSNNDLIIYDCDNTYTTTHDSLISIDMSNVLYISSSNSSKKVGYICISNKLSTQSYLNTSYNAINTSYNSYIQ